MTQQSNQSFNPEYFENLWNGYADEDYDVVIIGGGSVGAGAAADAATRGLKTAVIEARDFAAGTSSRSSKMFHGGLRYLAMFDFRLVAESLKERELNMSTLAPHLVKPLKFIFPLTHHVWERVMMFGGFTLYDLMGGSKSVPMQKHLTRKGVLKVTPGLKDDAIVGGVRYYDTLVDDARHTMTVLRTAAHYGATVRNSTQVTGFEKDGDRVTGVHVTPANGGAWRMPRLISTSTTASKSPVSAASLPTRTSPKPDPLASRASTTSAIAAATLGSGPAVVSLDASFTAPGTDAPGT